MARYLEQLAGAYHRWYDNCRVIPPAGEPVEDVHRTRLVLNEAVGQVLRNGLGLLGVTRAGAHVTDGARPPVGARTDPTLPIPVQRTVRRRRRGRRALLVVLIVLIVLLILPVIAFVIGDRIFRSTAEGQIERSVSQSLPAGVTGNVSAKIGGGSALLQYLQGSFDDVTLTSKGLKVANAPASAVVHVTGLPVHGGKVQHATASFVIAPGRLQERPGAAERGRLVAAARPGQRLDDAHAEDPRPRREGGRRASRRRCPGRPCTCGRPRRRSTAGPATIPATAIVQQLLPNGVSVCAASYLPRGVDVTSVHVRTGEAVVGLAAKDVDLNTLGLGAHRHLRLTPAAVRSRPPERRAAVPIRSCPASGTMPGPLAPHRSNDESHP